MGPLVQPQNEDSVNLSEEGHIDLEVRSILHPLNGDSINPRE